MEVTPLEVVLTENMEDAERAHMQRLLLKESMWRCRLYNVVFFFMFCVTTRHTIGSCFTNSRFHKWTLVLPFESTWCLVGCLVITKTDHICVHCYQLFCQLPCFYWLLFYSLEASLSDQNWEKKKWHPSLHLLLLFGGRFAFLLEIRPNSFRNVKLGISV